MDAFVIGHFQEPGLVECRNRSDIPLIGLGESTMLHAYTLERKVCRVTINSMCIPWHADQIVRHGVAQRVVGVRAIDAEVESFTRAFQDEAAGARLREHLCRRARPLIEQGVDVIVPTSGRPMLSFAREQVFIINGAIVVNGIAVLAEVVEMAVTLRRLTDIVVSRRERCAKASAGAIREFLDAR